MESSKRSHCNLSLFLLVSGFLGLVPGKLVFFNWGHSSPCTAPVLFCTTKCYSVLESVQHRTIPLLLCATKYYSSTTFALQSTTPVLLCTTSTTPVLLGTTMYYSTSSLSCKVPRTSTTLYYKVLTTVLQLQSATVLLCSTKFYSSISSTLYYKVLLQYHSVLLCVVLLQYHSALQSTTPVLLCTTKYFSSTARYNKVLLQYHSLLESAAPALLCTTAYYFICASPVALCTAKYHKTILSSVLLCSAPWGAWAHDLRIMRPTP